MPKLRMIYRRDGMEFTSNMIVDRAPKTGDSLDIVEGDHATRTYKVEAVYPVERGNLVTNKLPILDADRIDYVVEFETYRRTAG